MLPPIPISQPPNADQSQLSFITIQSANKAFATGTLLEARELCTKALVEYTPYHAVAYANRACIYSRLGYPDLAAGDAYRAVMLMEYVRAVLDGLEEDTDEEQAPGDSEKLTGVRLEQEQAEKVTSTTEDAEGDGSDEEGEPVSIFTHIAQAAFSTISHFLKLNNSLPVDAPDVPRAELSAFVTKLDLLASFYLINSLRQTSSLLDAYEFCESTLKRYGPDAPNTQPTSDSAAATGTGPGEDLQITPATFTSLRTTIMAEMNIKLEKAVEAQDKIGDIAPEKSRTILSSGIARRECYPWNSYEPDRFSDETLRVLNANMKECAERALGPGNIKCEAKVVDLPNLNIAGEATMSKHLGIFAAQDIYEGEVFFEEVVTISGSPYPGRRILCDYCSEKLNSENIHTCPNCPTSATSKVCADGETPLYPAYCSPTCVTLASLSHHPTLCHHEDDLSWIYDDIVSSPNPMSMYSTLVIKILATALHRKQHPLTLNETRHLYGAPPPSRGLTMRWDFVSCVVRPIWILTQGLGVDIYACPSWFDTWVINTIMAKVMGTCSGRFEPTLTLSQECDVRPDVVNIHPTWSLVNHDCEPNTGWKPEGKGRFWGLHPRGVEQPRRDMVVIKKGEEVKSCYTDRKLSVKVRREWARDMLGGDCICSRCVREEEMARESVVEEQIEKLKV